MRRMTTKNEWLSIFKDMYDLPANEWEKLKDPSLREIPSATLFLQGADWLNHLYQHRDSEITIYPDYDTDGITSGVYLYACLKLFGVGSVVNIQAPDSRDGFGLSLTSVDKTLQAFPNTELIITTDNGTGAIEGIAYAKEKGIPTLVSDHHTGERDGSLPDALAIANPNVQGDTYPFKHLSGGGVVYILMNTYAERLFGNKFDDVMELLLPLIGLSTVADVMDIVEVNHSLVKRSLQAMNSKRYLHDLVQAQKDFPEIQPVLSGWMAMLLEMERKNIAKQPYDERTFGWALGPIFNSPRRVVKDSSIGFSLFLQDTPAKSREIANQLIEMNDHRKQVVRDAKQTVSDFDPYEDHVLFTQADAGVVGLIAGQYEQDYDRPFIAFSQPSTKGLQGSGRAPDGFELLAEQGSGRLGVLEKVHEQHPELFVSFGGHPQACGVTILSDEQSVNTFKQAFNQACLEAAEDRPYQKLSGVPASLKRPIIHPNKQQPEILLGKSLDVERLHRVLNELKDAEPFGKGFPPPSISLTIDLESDYVSWDTIGSEGQHVKIELLDVDFALLEWNVSDAYLLNNHRYVTIVCELSENSFMGVRSLQGLIDYHTFHDEVHLADGEVEEINDKNSLFDW